MVRKLCGVLVLACLCVPVVAQDRVPAVQRTHACDRAIALAAAEEILNSSAPLAQPQHLYFAAAVLFDEGRKDEAVFWQWVALLRGWYQFGEVSNEELLSNMQRRTAGPITHYALQDTKRLEKILALVQAWDRKITDSIEEKERVYRKLDDLRARIAAQREVIEEQARATPPELAEERASTRQRTCLKVLVPPSDAWRIIAPEMRQVVEYVRNQPAVVRAVGQVQGASVAIFTVEQNGVLPSRYEVNVRGDQLVIAIVDTLRESSRVEFKLVCMTRTPSVRRDHSKDPCKQ